MDRRVVEQLKSFPERNRYLPGLRAWVGFKQVGVPIARRSRYEKATRVGFRRLWRLAMNAVFSFSYVPLFVFRIIGVGTVGLSVALIAVALYHKFFTGKAIPAWTSLLTAISFFGGMNIIGLSVVGEYVARIYDEAKGRPLYIIDRISKNV
jgi:dolichol-phosphate mannosyltransferase